MATDESQAMSPRSGQAPPATGNGPESIQPSLERIDYLFRNAGDGAAEQAIKAALIRFHTSAGTP